MKKNVKYISHLPTKNIRFGHTVFFRYIYKSKTTVEKIASFKHLFYLCRQIEKHYGSQQ